MNHVRSYQEAVERCAASAATVVFHGSEADAEDDGSEYWVEVAWPLRFGSSFGWGSDLIEAVNNCIDRKGRRR